MPKRLPRGQTLAEIVIAMGLFVLAISFTLGLLRSQLTNLEVVRGTTRAANRAEEGIEATRSIRDRSWSLLTAGAHGLSLIGDTWNFVGTSDSADGLTRTVTIAPRSINEQYVTSTVTWDIAPGRSRSLSVGTILSNWRNIIVPTLSGDWQNPRSLGSIDLGPGNEGTSLAVRSKLVYMGAKASDKKKDDFYVINATNGEAPFIAGQVDTGRGLNAVAISGSLAYVAQDFTSGQLQIINIAAPSSPSLVSSFSVTGNGLGISVGVSGTTALLGTPPTMNPELFLIDVSNPSSPSIVGSLEITGTVYDIAIQGSYAYLATSRDDRELMILDISDPTTPIQIGAVDLPGDDDAYGVYVNSQDNWAHVARESDGSHLDHNELVIIDVDNPLVPTVLGTLEVSEDTNAVVAADYLSFIGTSNASEEFQIYEVSDPAMITYWSGFNFPQVANDLALEDNVIYVAVRSNDALRIITSGP
ncbi:hypothetical protein HY478_02085 [Candidatus Uhrbacteria bacterium]|nr:hypothetical protein [Candidatus Uhrbacteria bacterium]